MAGGRFRVQSSSHPETYYDVARALGRWWCSCYQFKFQFYCKHVLAVDNIIAHGNQH